MKSVFISSTFKDMQAERDYFHEKVFPRLQRALQPMGESIQELDLRWGVDTSNMTEEESGKQVLKVCIDAIDRCKPYTVVLLGERYGWIPGISVVKEAGDARVDAHYQENMSITNLEIRYAALDNKQMLERCIFCFRSPKLLNKMEGAQRGIYAAESPEHQARLNLLKEEIRGLPDAKIVEYEADWDPQSEQVIGIENLGEQVYELLLAMMEKELQDRKPRTPEEQVETETAFLMERYLSTYIPRDAEEYAVLKQVFDYAFSSRYSFLGKKTDYTFLCGEAGSGKSALMASCAHRLMENGDCVLLYFCGAPGCQSPQMLKRMLIYKLEKFLEIPEGGTRGMPEERLTELNRKLNGRQVICFLDGVDQMFPKGSELYLDVLGLCPQVYFVMSALSDFPLEELVKKAARPVTRIDLGSLRPFQARAVIDAATIRRGKKLDEELVKDIIQKKGAGNPLYLSLILQRFFMMDGREFRQAEEMSPGMEGLHLYMERLLAELPQEPEVLIRKILLETGARFGEGEFAELLELLAVSRDGLSETELETLMKLEGKPFSQLRFQQIISYLYDAFDLSDQGKWGFSHRLFREALLAQPGIPKARHLLARLALEDKDFLRREGYAYILEERLPEGIAVLEEGQSFADPAGLYDCVAEILRRGDTAYFAAMLEESPSKALVDFWIEAFPAMRYGTDAQKLQLRFIRSLLEKGVCTPRQQARGFLVLMQQAMESEEFERAAAFLGKARKAVEALSGSEKALLLVQTEFYEGELAWRQERNEECLRHFEKAGEIAEAASADTEETLIGELASWRIRVRCAWIGENIAGERLLLSAWEKETTFLSEVKERLSGSVYAPCRLRLLSERMELLRAEELTGEEKITAAETLIQEAKGLTDQYPSAGSARRMYLLLEDFRSFAPEAQQYCICRDMIGYTRRLTELEGTQENFECLMYTLFAYADEADRVLMGQLDLEKKWEIGSSDKEAWTEGFAILEDLQKAGYKWRNPLQEIVYWHWRYYVDRMGLGVVEAEYPTIIGHAKEILRLYEAAGDTAGSVNADSWLRYFRRAHLILGKLYMKIHETEKAIAHLKTAYQAAKELFSGKNTRKRLADILEIQEILVGALYQARQDEDALCAAKELEQNLIMFQVTNAEGMWSFISYVRGRIAFEQGDLDTARREVQKIGGKWEAFLKGKLPKVRYYLLKLDVALADGAFSDAEAAWKEAEDQLLKLWENKFTREKRPCLSSEIRMYLEYGYKKYVLLREKTGASISEEEQQEWHIALDAPLKDRVAKRVTEKEAEDWAKATEGEKMAWREAWKTKWEAFAPGMGQESADTLSLWLSLYQKLIKVDEYYSLPYALRRERQRLAQELYQRTADKKYVKDYLDETNRMATVTVSGAERFRKSGLHIYDREEEWDRCAWELLKELYEGSGDKDWLLYAVAYLHLTTKRKILSSIVWYEELFSYIQPRFPEQEDWVEELRRWRYEWERQTLLFEFRMHRVRDKKS